MHHDAIIIGGSFAGLSAAMQLARARRSVAVIDAGRPRNRFSEHSHGFFGQDGRTPAAMIADARAQVGAYPTIRIIEGEAVEASGTDGDFTVTLADGESLSGSKIVLAFGLRDELPDIPGLAERWGRSVLHCPYCHGFEYAGKRLGVLQSHPMSFHSAQLIPEWGPTTFFLNGAAMPDEETLARLARRGVTIEPVTLAALRGVSTSLSSILLADGRELAIEALYVAPKSRLGSPIAGQLGCLVEEAMMGDLVKTDAFKKTSVAGVFAAGDIARQPHNATFASADGVMAGASVHQSLVFEPLAA
jgi:thioredoxin reductase